MNEELFGGQVIEVKNCIHAEYLLSNNDAFYDIGFRVMKNQESGCLLPCHRLKYNGKIKLVYFTDGLVPLEQKLTEMDVEQMQILLLNLFEAIKEVEGNGFLNTSCIELRLDRIYVDNNTSVVKLIYLPMNLPVGSSSHHDIEKEIRKKLITRMRDIGLADHPRVQNVIEVLRDDNLDLEGVVRNLRSGVVIRVTMHETKGVVRTSRSEATNEVDAGLTLKAVDQSVTFVIQKNEYILGKSCEKADGVIEGNPAISRVHCKIFREGDTFYITDMGSSNGTFLDGKRIAVSEKARIEQGNQIRLANMEFIVWR